MMLITEIKVAIDTLKNRKAAGLDNMVTEQIEHFGRTTKLWLLILFNNIIVTLKIPQIWRKAKVIALLKPRKEPDTLSSYRPNSL